MTGRKQNEYAQGCQSAGNVGDHHHQFAVITIHHHPRDGRHKQEGCNVCDLHKRHGGGWMGLLVHVDRQGKGRHTAGKHRNDLPDPHYGETHHPAQTMFCLGLHWHLINNKSRKGQFYNKTRLILITDHRMVNRSLAQSTIPGKARANWTRVEKANGTNTRRRGRRIIPAITPATYSTDITPGR